MPYVKLNNLPPRYDFARRGIEVGKEIAVRIIDVGYIRGIVRDIHRAFFVVESPRGYCTAIAHWHLIKCRKTGEYGGIGA
jgi:hypothetical protein